MGSAIAPWKPRPGNHEHRVGGDGCLQQGHHGQEQPQAQGSANQGGGLVAVQVPQGGYPASRQSHGHGLHVNGLHLHTHHARWIIEGSLLEQGFVRALWAYPGFFTSG